MTVQLLDCTLRDGGLGLEDIAKTVPSEKGMTRASTDQIINDLAESNIDIIELGSVEISDNDKRCFCIYRDIESISKTMPLQKNPNQMFAALYRGPDTPIEDIPDWNESLCKAVRVIIRYSELQKSLDFCSALSEKGYKVFVQPMLTMRYTKEELDLMIRQASLMNAYALYFVDSYGYMQYSDVEYFFNKYDSGLAPDIKIGFHSHNNMNLAYANVLHLLNLKSDRSIIIDSCATGMGQGAGNLQTELIVPYLNDVFSKEYNFNKVLDVCEEVEKYTPSGKWGYSVVRLIPAVHKTAYKYALALRNQYGLRYSDINRILENIPEKLRYRYTAENTEELLRIMNYPTEGKII